MGVISTGSSGQTVPCGCSTARKIGSRAYPCRMVPRAGNGRAGSVAAGDAASSAAARPGRRAAMAVKCFRVRPRGAARFRQTPTGRGRRSRSFPLPRRVRSRRGPGAAPPWRTATTATGPGSDQSRRSTSTQTACDRKPGRHVHPPTSAAFAAGARTTDARPGDDCEMPPSSPRPRTTSRPRTARRQDPAAD